MDISYHGNACVSIVAKPLSGDVRVVLDPYDSSTGLRFPRTMTADVVFASQAGEVHGATEGVGGDPFTIAMPGEYEVKGVMFDARPLEDTNERAMLLRLSAEGVTVGFLGGLSRALKDTELELLEGVDVLILPAGGGAGLSPKMAAETMQAVEPRVVIPVYVAEAGLKADLEPVTAFKRQVGAMRTEEGNKFKVTAAKLPQDDVLLVLLARTT